MDSDHLPDDPRAAQRGFAAARAYERGARKAQLAMCCGSFVALAILSSACTKKAASQDVEGWAKVVALSEPASSPAAGQLLYDAMFAKDGRTQIATAIAWAKARGGLPWRGFDERQITRRDTEAESASRLGRGLIADGSPDARVAAAYLGWRLRAEPTSWMDTQWGFELAREAQADGIPQPDFPDVLRGIASSGVAAVAVARIHHPERVIPLERLYVDYLADISTPPALLAHVKEVVKRCNPTGVAYDSSSPDAPALHECTNGFLAAIQAEIEHLARSSR